MDAYWFSLGIIRDAASTLTTGVSQPSLSGTSGFSLVVLLSGPGLADDMSSVSISSLVTSLLSLTGASLWGIIGTVLRSLSFCIWWILYLVGWLLRSGELGQFSFHLF